MRVLGHMVTRNEANRYLERMLSWHAPQLDGIHVYDDRSTDHTVDVARTWATVDVRPDGAPSFMDNEALFRTHAWQAMCVQLKPEAGDLIIALDADEFLVHNGGSERPLRDHLLAMSREIGVYRLPGKPAANAVTFPVTEVWADTGVETYKRVDGFWDQITATRLLAHRDHVKPNFAARVGLGGGSLPVYAQPHHKVCTRMQIVHVGYLNPEDRQGKYRRYTENTGHGSRHVKSIIQTPELRAFRDDLACGNIKVAPWRP